MARRLALLLSALLLVLLAPAVDAGFESATGDDQGTFRGDGVGPAAPGLAWVSELEDFFPLDSTAPSGGFGGIPGYGYPVVTDAVGHLLIAGRDATDEVANDGALRALDPATGDVVWSVADILPNCTVTSGADGTLYATRTTESTVTGPFELIAIDPVDGTVEVAFAKEAASRTDPKFSPCTTATGNPPLRTSADGTILLVRERTFGDDSGSATWLRGLDITTTPATQRFVIRFDSTSEFGAFGGVEDDVRIAPADGPAAGDIYLVERVAGPTDGEDDDDRNFLHVVGIDDLAGEILLPDVIDRSVELPATELLTGAWVVDEDAIIMGMIEQLPDRMPEDPEDVNGRMVRVVDDGTTLTLDRARPTFAGALAEDGDLAGPMQNMALTSDGLLVGNPRFLRSSALSGLDPVTLEATFREDDLPCVVNDVLADGAGNAFLHDACANGPDTPLGGALVSVTGDGFVNWLLSHRTVQPVAAGGTVDLDRFSDPEVVNVTDDGLIIVGAAARESGAGYDGSVFWAVSVGRDIERSEGPSRVETATAISGRIFPLGADVVVLARADDYPDALSGAPLAVAERGPLLLTDPRTLSSAVGEEIRRLGASRVIILGGEAAVSRDIADTLEDRSLVVERIAGDSRFSTAAMVAARIGASAAVVVEGRNVSPLRGWPDAVAASAWAAQTGRAILLVEQDRLPEATARAVTDLSLDDLTVVGGEVAVSSDVEADLGDLSRTVTRIDGDTRYATSAMVAARSVADGTTLDNLWIATGTSFPDALAAGPAAALTSGALVLVDGRNPDGSTATYDFLEANRDAIGVVHLVGSEGAITADVAERIARALGR